MDLTRPRQRESRVRRRRSARQLRTTDPDEYEYVYEGMCGVSPKTLLRWQKLPEFERTYRGARMAAFRQSTARLQQASSPAVTTLKIMVDPTAPMAVKARCAYYILDQATKAIETEEIEARVTELERTAATQKQGGRRRGLIRVILASSTGSASGIVALNA